MKLPDLSSLLRRRNRRVLGDHIVGKRGSELVYELVIEMVLNGTALDVANVIHIHLPLSEVVNAAAGGVHRPL